MSEWKKGAKLNRWYWFFLGVLLALLVVVFYLTVVEPHVLP